MMETIKKYMDIEGNEVPVDKAKMIQVAEYDDNDKLINETIFVIDQEDEDYTEQWQNVVLTDEDEALFKNAKIF